MTDEILLEKLKRQSITHDGEEITVTKILNQHEVDNVLFVDTEGTITRASNYRITHDPDYGYDEDWDDSPIDCYASLLIILSDDEIVNIEVEDLQLL